MKKFFKENKKLVIIISILVIIYPFVILVPSPIGFISYETGLTLIGYGGSIIGGFLTLYGVGWTIHEQKNSLKNQQDKIEQQRREDLAIQYKPYLFVPSFEPTKIYTSQKVLHIPPFQAVYIISVGELEPNKKSISDIFIKNYGNGECYLETIENPIIISDVPFAYKDLNLSEEHISANLKKGFKHIIPRNDTFKIHLEIHFNDRENLKNDYFNLIFHLLYNDQFNIKCYDATTQVIFEIHNNNITLNGVSISNKPITDGKIESLEKNIEINKEISEYMTKHQI